MVTATVREETMTVGVGILTLLENALAVN